MNQSNETGTLNDYDLGGIHNHFIVVGHAAYLMNHHGVFRSREEMAKFWYQSLFWMSRYSNF